MTAPQLDEPDEFEVIKRMRYDLTALQAKLTDLQNMLNTRKLEPAAMHRCGRCGVTKRSERGLAEHGYLQHGGPEPEHWAEAERKTA